MTNENMNEADALKVLSALGKNKDISSEDIRQIASNLNGSSVKLCAKALWLLGEIGLKNTKETALYIADIAGHLNSDEALLRERSMNALGRIGRADYNLTEPYFSNMTALSNDTVPAVRLAFIWACENIAVNTPEIFFGIMPCFALLLKDENVRVRIEAPEIFRVLAKRKPEFVEPYIDMLRNISQTDENEIVRIHANGAVKAAERFGLRHT